MYGNKKEEEKDLTAYFDIGSQEPGILRSKIPELEMFFAKISYTTMIQEIPVISMIFSLRIHDMDIFNMYLV